MREVGQRYEKGEYFVAGLIMSGEIFREVVERVQPLLEQRSDGNLSGRVLVGTVSGDIHDIGKNMFGMLLSCHGFDVIDLGGIGKFTQFVKVFPMQNYKNFWRMNHEPNVNSYNNRLRNVQSILKSHFKIYFRMGSRPTLSNNATSEEGKRRKIKKCL